MHSKKRIVFGFLIFCFCCVLAGCETTIKKAEELDAWVEENMW